MDSLDRFNAKDTTDSPKKHDSPDLPRSPDLSDSSGGSSSSSMRSEIDDLKDALRRGQEREEALSAYKSSLSQEQLDLRNRLITHARRIQSHEGRIDGIEERLRILDLEAATLRASLSREWSVLSDLLFSLQVFEHNPPPALAVYPDDILFSFRGAVLLSEFVDYLNGHSEDLSYSLSRLDHLEEDLRTERDILDRALVSLRKERTALSSLLASRMSLSDEVNAVIATHRDAMRALAGRAVKLQDFLSSIERRRASLGGNAFRPRVKFSRLRSRVPFPAQGVLVSGFGDVLSDGSVSEGLYLSTRRDSHMTSPVDGRVVYADYFRDYSGLLILDAGEGYHMVMAGLSDFDVSAGMFVLAGEPLGRVGSGSFSDRVLSLHSDRSILYIELRKGGAVMNSSPWWIGADRVERKDQ